VIIVGGIKDKVGSISSQCLEYDPETNCIKRFPDMLFPRKYTAVVWNQGSIYAIGGKPEIESCEKFCYA